MRQIIADWPGPQQNVARQLLGKYGPPNEATPTRLFWHHNHPWKRTELTSDVVVHHWPTPHTDFLSQYLDYRVPPELTHLVTMFDGSILVDRTRDEVAARCDSEAANVLGLNMVHELVIGKRTIEEEATDRHSPADPQRPGCDHDPPQPSRRVEADLDPVGSWGSTATGCRRRGRDMWRRHRPGATERGHGLSAMAAFVMVMGEKDLTGQPGSAASLPEDGPQRKVEVGGAVASNDPASFTARRSSTSRSSTDAA